MELDQTEIKKIGDLIEKSHRILILSHKNPDGDTIGSAIALYQAFLNMKKEPRLACVDPPAPVFNYLPHIKEYSQSIGALDYDAYFTVDCGARYMTDFHQEYPQIFDKSLPTVNIDHHGTNDYFGQLNLVVPDAPAATMVVYELLRALRIPIDRHIATALLTGIYTDTGSFMHSNATAGAFRCAADLLNRGANLRQISKEIFGTISVSTLRLWGRVLKNITRTEAGVTLSVVTQKDFVQTGAGPGEMSGVIDYVNSVPGAPYSVILTEQEGKVKGSLRTLREEINVAEIAGRYGGGGHIKAAGFTLPGELQKEVRWKVVESYD